jgi:hypothetical protein
MYQNSLHEVIDASRKMKILPSDDIPDGWLPMAGDVVKSLPLIAGSAICFIIDIEDTPEINVSIPLIRLPYPVCWFEFDCGQSIKFCLLCTEKNQQINVVFLSKVFDGTWVFKGTYEINPGVDLVKAAGKFGDVEQNCFMYLFQFLTALNCCNIKRTEHKPKPSQQSVRRALGRQPLFSTWTLEIDLERTEREFPGESSGGHTSKRLHLCRGHARQHKPGQWCWVRAHVRGDKSLGMIHKDYASH